MKALYLEPFAGISGNMLLGALIDAGFPVSELEGLAARLGLQGCRLVSRRVDKLGIDAQFFDVELDAAGNEWVDAGHGHAHDHSHSHSHSHSHAHVHRTLADIAALVGGSAIPEGAKRRAMKIFGELAAAEGKVHGKPAGEVHFHEVGAVDSIIDIVGCALALEWLGIERIYTGTVTVGSGLISCAHGLMPVPAPATAELLRGIPTVRGEVPREMTTPTGAAVLRALVEYSEDLPAGFCAERVAYGAGKRDVKVPNVLRAYVGSIQDHAAEDGIVEACCNIDDMTGELFSAAIASLMKAGALDAWAEPIVMKKGRPAYRLAFLARRSGLDALIRQVLRETTTLGVRWHPVERTVLDRRFESVATPWGEVSVKLGYLDGELVNAAPEFDSVAATAAAAGVPAKAVYDAARAAALHIS